MSNNKKTPIVGYDSKGVPIILCSERKDFSDGFTFYCQYCKRPHYHGSGSGRREAHCINPLSPFRKQGYIVIKP